MSIRTTIYPSGAVLDLPEDTLTIYAPRAIDESVGLAVEVRRYARNGEVIEDMAGSWEAEFAFEFPTTKRARIEADEEAVELYGEGASGGLGFIDERGGLEVPLSRESLGERCMIHLGERDGHGRRLWRLARREIPRMLLDEAERLLLAVNLLKARERFNEGMRGPGVLGHALRLAIVQVERAGLDASGLVALRARCHDIVGHSFGA